MNKIDVADRIAAAGKKSPPAAPAAVRAIPGPSAEDLAAAARIPPSQQREMAEGMVARLDARLRSEPHDPDGWLMLMRSRMMLEQPDKASQALRDAVAANPDKADMLRQQSRTLGVR
jgi:cytochrome c-type biogenesis protein CcmH